MESSAAFDLAQTRDLEPCVDAEIVGESSFALVQCFGSCPEYQLWRGLEIHPGGQRTHCVVQYLSPVAPENDDRRWARFVEDANIAMQARHPNLAVVRQVGETDGQPFVLREYVSGSNLRAIAVEAGVGGLPVDIIAGIGAKLAGALSALHDAPTPLPHGRVRPTTILIDGRGEPLLTEVALGRLPDAPPLQIGRRSCDGYLAPEVVEGGEAGTPADIFALGVILLELIGGAPFPWSGRSALETVVQHAADWCHRRAALPERFESLLRAMTTRKPERRPTAATVSSYLASVAGDAAHVAAGETPLGRLARPRHSFSVAPRVAALESVPTTDLPRDALSTAPPAPFE